MTIDKQRYDLWKISNLLMIENLLEENQTKEAAFTLLRLFLKVCQKHEGEKLSSQ